MKRLHILADDLTGALDCAAAFGADVPVHLGRPAHPTRQDVDVVATATRDVAIDQLPAGLTPCLPWLQEAAIAFKKVDSLLRGNTFDEVDWLARQGGYSGLVMAPAFPSQGRITCAGQQWWTRPGHADSAVAERLSTALAARGWHISTEAERPSWGETPTAWIPDVRSDADLDPIAALALQDSGRWLWCGSAGLAHALARQRADAPQVEALATPHVETGHALMLVSASHHPVSREQWRQLRQSEWGRDCVQGSELLNWQATAGEGARLFDLAAAEPLSAKQAAQLLDQQTALLAERAPRPRTLVVVGGDTLLALCRALGAQGLQSETPLNRPGWGCARLRGGRWDGLVCHSRSGAFGQADDLLAVVAALTTR
ncbi:four-carbon acid sugar kinase family protein [Curvibacter sp. RS43]|uniref:four-carbon acid sugar kinase family protein n=1 Tax=Curvibacter microcysteis TaxID=3026419 RepID=UPI002361972B|nr:four-carbon acid sugar kinase family protein [Curvibacter sp. RS43]MDD0812568.1 four-carbon acid sugar kinase family protein [Curvibacter sp. RS43]